MDLFSHINIRWLLALSLVRMSYQMYLLKPAESFHRQQTKAHALTKMVQSSSNRFNKISSQVDRQVFSENMEPIRRLPSVSPSEVLGDIMTTNVHSGNDEKQPELGSKSSPLAIRFRRSSHFHRSRCCYIDVMCSRGCRRPWGRHRQIRSSLKRLLRGINAGTRGLESTTPRQPKDDKRQQPTDLESEAKMSTKQNELFMSVGKDSRNKSRPTSRGKNGVDNRKKSIVFSRSKRSRFYPSARNFNRPSRKLRTMKTFLPATRDTESDIIDGLPQILDSLEYLMKNKYPV